MNDTKIQAIIRLAKQESKPKTLSESIGGRGTGSLVLKATPSGGKFYITFKRSGKRQWTLIGSYPALSLKHARTKAQEWSALHQSGENVKAQMVADRQKQQSRGTFAELLFAYCDSLDAKGAVSARDVRGRITRHVIKPFQQVASLKACQVTTDHIMEILNRMADNGITTTTNRLRDVLVAAFNWAMKRKIGQKANNNFGITHNPAAAIERCEDWERVCKKTVPLATIYDLWHSLDINIPPTICPIMGGLIQMMLLLGQRPKQLLQCTWRDVDWQARTLRIENRKNKNQFIHILPLTDRAIAVLKQLRKIRTDDRLIFSRTAGKPIPTTSVTRELCIHLKAHSMEPFPAKYLRASWKTHTKEAGLSNFIRDLIQTHSRSDISGKHYDDADYNKDIRKGLEAWEKYLFKQGAKNRE